MYLKDAYEMSLLFDREIIENTNDLLRRCNVTIETNQMHLPHYPLPEKCDEPKLFTATLYCWFKEKI